MAVLVLSRLDERYFRDISARSSWNLNFVLVKEGEKEPLAESVHTTYWARSVNLEIELEAGKYFVYVSLESLFHRRECPTERSRSGLIVNSITLPSMHQ